MCNCPSRRYFAPLAAHGAFSETKGDARRVTYRHNATGGALHLHRWRVAAQDAPEVQALSLASLRHRLGQVGGSTLCFVLLFLFFLCLSIGNMKSSLFQSPSLFVLLASSTGWTE